MQMLRRSAGGLELIDVGEQLPALKRQQGKTQWVVRDRSGYRNSYSEVEQVCDFHASAWSVVNCCFSQVWPRRSFIHILFSLGEGRLSLAVWHVTQPKTMHALLPF